VTSQTSQTSPASHDGRAARWLVSILIAVGAATTMAQGTANPSAFLPRFPTPPPVAPPPIGTPGAKPVIQASDITYVGAIRMPESVDTMYAYGGISGRIVNGHVRFFLYGNTTKTPKDAVYEIEDPGSGYNTDYRQAPRAKLITNWGDVYHGKRISFDNAGNPLNLDATLIPIGLHWNESTQLLYWTYGDAYNVSHRPDWDLGATVLNDPTTASSTAYGPWRPVARDGDGNSFYGPWRCVYLFANPFDGSMMCGSGPQSGNSGSPFGPDAYGGAAWPTSATPAGPRAADISLPQRYLEYYFMGGGSGNYIDQNGAVHGKLRSFRRTNNLPVWENFPNNQPLRVNPALNGGVGSWSEVDGASGAVWLELTNKRGVLFSAFLVGSPVQNPSDCVNAAHEWYSNAGVNPPIGACSHGCAPPVQVTGPVTTAAFPALIIMDPDQLMAVRNGTIPDYSPDARAVIDLEQAYNIRTVDILTIGHGKTVRGMYFDPVRKYLFVVAPMADNTGPFPASALIHVFAIRD